MSVNIQITRWDLTCDSDHWKVVNSTDLLRRPVFHWPKFSSEHLCDGQGRAVGFGATHPDRVTSWVFMQINTVSRHCINYPLWMVGIAVKASDVPSLPFRFGTKLFFEKTHSVPQATIPTCVLIHFTCAAFICWLTKIRAQAAWFVRSQRQVDVRCANSFDLPVYWKSQAETET